MSSRKLSFITAALLVLEGCRVYGQFVGGSEIVQQGVTQSYASAAASGSAINGGQVIIPAIIKPILQPDTAPTVPSFNNFPSAFPSSFPPPMPPAFPPIIYSNDDDDDDFNHLLYFLIFAMNRRGCGSGYGGYSGYGYGGYNSGYGSGCGSNCGGNCGGGCGNNYNGGCGGSCNGGCSGNCGGNYNSGCGGSCNGGCSGNCGGNYNSGCGGNCGGSCGSSYSGCGYNNGCGYSNSGCSNTYIPYPIPMPYNNGVYGSGTSSGTGTQVVDFVPTCGCGYGEEIAIIQSPAIQTCNSQSPNEISLTITAVPCNSK